MSKQECSGLTVRVRPRRLRWIAGTIAVAWLVFLTVLGAGRAAAAPDEVSVIYALRYEAAVCQTLDEYPTVPGVVGIVNAIVGDGLTAGQAGEVIAMSVIDMCPQHEGLLRRFIAQFATGGGSFNTKVA